MGILIFIITLRLKRILLFNHHPIRTAGILLSLLLSILYGLIISYIFNSYNFPINNFSRKDFILSVILALAIITFLHGFFPTYTPLHRIISNNYPIGRLNKFICNIANEFMSPFYLVISVFILIVSSLINSKGFEILIFAIGWVIISHMLKRLVKLFIQFQINGVNNYLIITLSIIGILIYSQYITAMATIFNQLISLMVLAFLFILNYKLDSNNDETTAIEHNKRKYGIGFSLKLLFNNRSLRIVSILTIVMKILFFLFWGVLINNKRNEIFYDIYFPLHVINRNPIMCSC